ncbi:MAG: aminoacyl-tRNA hydrolase [bacterium JZ-2024 1]
MSRILFGLGNPGPEYRHTRHNLGALIVEEFSRRIPLKKTGKRWHGLWAVGIWKEEEIHLVRPLTFMNLSGMSVKTAVDHTRFPLDSLLVVCDDFTLPFQEIRIRRKGSSGGHKGLESIEQALQTREFPRLRLGIGPLPRDVPPEDFVLSPFTPEESASLPSFVDYAIQAIFCWLEKGIEVAMRTFNRKKTALKPVSSSEVIRKPENPEEVED